MAVEFPWESRFEYKCRADKIAQYTAAMGELRATALANVWANVHFLGLYCYLFNVYLTYVKLLVEYLLIYVCFIRIGISDMEFSAML